MTKLTGKGSSTGSAATSSKDSQDWPQSLLIKFGDQIDNDGCKALVKDPDFAKAGKSIAMIRGKAISLGIYQKSDPSSKPAGTVAKPQKQQLVDAIATLVSAPKSSLDSLVKGNREALELLNNQLIAMSEQANLKQKANA